MLPTYSLCHAQVNAELNTRLSFHSGWKRCSANAISESEAMSQINGNEMFHFPTGPKSDSLPDGASAEETRFLLSAVIKSNQTGSTWKHQLPESAESKYQPSLSHSNLCFSRNSLVILVFLRGGLRSFHMLITSIFHQQLHVEACEQEKKYYNSLSCCFVRSFLLTCFAMLNWKDACRRWVEILAWVGLLMWVRASSGPFMLLLPLLRVNIKCLLAKVISNGEANTGELNIYKNSVK